jgi:hypothetical protein
LRWPGANIAIRTGAPSQLVVLDLDGDEGADALHELELAHGALPRTGTVQTPRGGSHYYFAHPGLEVPNSAAKLGQGIDIRGDGGYVLAPPSVGSNGRRYVVDEEAPIAALPHWLLERIACQPGRGARPAPPSDWLRIVRGVPEGQRNESLARLIGHLLRHYVDVDLVSAIAHMVNNRCQPPLGHEELERILDSIASRELRRRTGPER